jgi:Mg2+ and Co2+ transporter CorA
MSLFVNRGSLDLASFQNRFDAFDKRKDNRGFEHANNFQEVNQQNSSTRFFSYTLSPPPPSLVKKESLREKGPEEKEGEETRRGLQFKFFFFMSTQESLVQQWTDALRVSDIPVDLQRLYAQSFANEFVTLELGHHLSDQHLDKIGIRIGHRQAVLRHAANYQVALSLSAGGKQAVKLSNALLDGISRVPRNTTCGITWESLSGTAESLDKFTAFMSGLMAEYRFPPSFVKCFEDNKPMPFVMHHGSNITILLRIPDLSNKVGTTLASITNRVVIFATGSNILTYHRCACNPFKNIEDNFATEHYSEMNQSELLGELVRQALETYTDGHAMLQKWSDETDEMPDKIDAAEEFTLLQKQASVYLRCLSSNIAVIKDILEKEPTLKDTFDDTLKDLETTSAKIEEVQENAVGSIDLLIALDDFKNGSNLKLFTYLSVICQPIGVATGWYGMNFANMPELKFQESYFVFMTVVLGLCGLIVTFLIYHAYKK